MVVPIEYFVNTALIVYILSMALPCFTNIPLVLLSLSGVLSICTRAPQKFQFSHSAFFLFCFLFFFFISAILSVDIQRTLSLSPSIVPGLILFYLIGEHTDRHRFHLFYGTFAIASTLVAMIALHTAWANPQASPTEWVLLTHLPYFIVPNDFMLLSVFIPYLVAMAMEEKSGWIKAAASAGIVLQFLLLTIYQSRGGILLALMAIFMTIILIRRKLKQAVLLLTIGCVMVGCIDFVFGFQFLSKLTLGADSWFTRLMPWTVAWDIFTSHPIFGSGPRTFGLFYPEMPWAHNLYLEVLAEQGGVGILALIGLIISVFYQLNPLKSDASMEKIILFCSCSILFLGGIIEFSFIRHLFVILFFALMSLVIYEPTFNPKDV